MKKALLKSKNIIVFIHENKKPSMEYNYNKVVVSKQPNSPYIFSASVADLELL